MKSNYILIVVLLLAVGGGAFYGGMRYQESKTPRLGMVQGDRARVVGQRAGAGFRPVNGEIISRDEKSITVKLSDGSSKIVMISDSTQINQATSVGKETLKAGEKVAVFGQENSDGSVTAQNVQLNPQLREVGGSGPQN